MYLHLISFLIPLFCFAESITPYITSEDNTLALVDNLVNVENGKFVQIDREIWIRGSDPFTLTRYYDNGRHFDSEFGFGMGASLPVLVQVDFKRESENFGMQDRIGTLYPCNLRPIKGKKEEFHGAVNPKIFSLGYTNCCQAQLRGEPTAHSTKIWGNKKAIIVTLGDGTKRHYHFYKKGNGVSQFRLIQEDRPNGNKRYFQYTFPDHRIVSSIETRDKTGTLTLYRIDFEYNKNHAWIKASNGQAVDIHKKLVAEIAKGSDGKKYEYPAYVVKDRTASHLPTLFCEHKENAPNYEDLYCLKKISEGEGRDVEVEYDKKHRVQKLFLGRRLQYSFDYFSDHTDVKNSLGHGRTYWFANKRLIKLVEPHKTQINDWDYRGQLLRNAVFDPAGRFVHEKTYAYDTEGRIVVVVVDGEMTKKGARDRYGIEYTYTGDELHLLSKEVHHNEITYRYSYLPGTNLRLSKIASKDNVVFEREFYDYDAHGFLIFTLKDDGTCPADKNNLAGVTFRKITEIEPEISQGMPGLSQPKVIREYYLDIPTGQKHLLKKIERIYGNRDLVVEERVYDANERFAYSQKWCYNDREELIAETNALGETSRYSYDNHGNKIFEESKGSAKRFCYDTQNLLIEEVENHGGRDFQTVHTYDAAGQRIVTRDRYCKTTWFHYDTAGRKIREQDPYAYEESYELDTEGRITKKVDKEGHATHTHYNFYGHPLEIQYPDNSTETFTYDIEGHLTEKRHRDGTREKYCLDERGRPLKIETFSLDGTLLKTILKEYKGPNLIREVDALGYETSYFYDGAGRKTKMMEGDKVTEYRYDALGRLSHTIHPLYTDVKLYDVLDRVIEERIEDRGGNVYHRVQYSYDILGNRTETRTFITNDEYSSLKEYYDSQNRLVQRIDPTGAITEIRYHETDHLEVETIDPMGRKTLEIHGACDEVRQRQTYSASGELLASAIFEYNRLQEKILHKEKVFGSGIIPYEYIIEFAYDPMGQKILEREAGQRSTSFSYDRGQLSTITKADGTSLHYIYDSLGRLASLTASDGTIDDHFYYDVGNNCLHAENRITGSNTERQYDRFHNVLYEKQASGIEFTYTYDEAGRPLEASFLNEKIAYTYNPYTLTSATRLQKGIPLYTYQQTTDLKGKIVENSCLGSTTSYSWNKGGALLTLQNPFLQENYRYDLRGRLITLNDNRFVYDDLDQLIEETGTFDHIYGYDSLYNRRQKDGITLDIDALNQVLSDSNNTYIYDALGRRIAKDSTRYSYDALGRLLMISTPEGLTRFTYDPFGRRISQEEDGHQSFFLYQLDAEIGRYDGALCEFRVLFSKESPFAIELEGVPYFPLRNYRGDIIALFDANASVQAVYHYDSFGNTSIQGTLITPWQFCGRRSFAGLLHFDKRDYDPQLGRWLTPDPLGLVDGPNLFTYVKNSPHLYFDPYGLFLAETKDFFSGMNYGFKNGASFGLHSYISGDFSAQTSYGNSGVYLGEAASYLIPYGALAKGLAYGAKAYRVVMGALKTEQTISKVALTQRAISNSVKTGALTREFGIQKISTGALSTKRGAENINAGLNLNRKLSQLERFQQKAERIRHLPDGRIRYYNRERIAHSPGPTRGSSYVTEYNPTTGKVRGWNECYDHQGAVNRVHPKDLNGQELSSPHYPLTHWEL